MPNMIYRISGGIFPNGVVPEEGISDAVLAFIALAILNVAGKVFKNNRVLRIRRVLSIRTTVHSWLTNNSGQSVYALVLQDDTAIVAPVASVKHT